MSRNKRNCEETRPVQESYTLEQAIYLTMERLKQCCFAADTFTFMIKDYRLALSHVREMANIMKTLPLGAKNTLGVEYRLAVSNSILSAIDKHIRRIEQKMSKEGEQ